MRHEPLDPEIAEVNRLQQQAGVTNAPDDEEPRAARVSSTISRLRFTPQIPLAVESITDIVIPGPAGEIPARVIRPVGSDRTRPTVLYFHGGAFLLGDLNSHEAHARRIANRVDAVVVHIDYRLAPENQFPAPIEDAVAAFEWVLENIGALGGDANGIGVAGDSAGGGIAAVLATIAAERALPLAAQLLAYPMTDWNIGQHGRIAEYYFGHDPESLFGHPWASPARSEHLAAVAPCVLAFGGHDFLLQDNSSFDERLTLLGVRHITRTYPTLPHGFMSCAGISEAAAAATDEICADFRALLERGAAS